MNGSATWLKKDFYKVLGVGESASAEEIKRAYRKLARRHHPDRNPGDRQAEERMKEISEAYDVLSDPRKRAEYDEMRRLARSGFRSRGFGAGPAGGSPFDISDLLGDFFGGARQPRAGRGVDLETEVRISFEDAIAGTTVPLRVARDVTCEECGGSGARPGSTVRTCEICGGTGVVGEDQGLFSFRRPCRRCGGSGTMIEEPCARCEGGGTLRRAEEIRVRVPAGVDDGSRVRVRGRGGAGERGAAAGDLYVVVRVPRHRLFGRRGADLTLDVPVTFAEAALGSQIKVPTLDGKVTLKIPAGTQSGRTFRVKGRGAPSPRGESGDLLVTVQVVVPQKLSPKERELLEKLGQTENGSLRAHLGV